LKEAHDAFDGFDERGWVEWAGEMLMPRLYRVVEEEKEANAEAEKARRIEEKREEIQARELEAKRVRFQSWREVRERELAALIEDFEADRIEATEYNKKEEELLKDLDFTLDDFEPEDDEEEENNEMKVDENGESEVANDFRETSKVPSSFDGVVLPATQGGKPKAPVAAMRAKSTIWSVADKPVRASQFHMILLLIVSMYSAIHARRGTGLATSRLLRTNARSALSTREAASRTTSTGEGWRRKSATRSWWRMTRMRRSSRSSLRSVRVRLESVVAKVSASLLRWWVY
jgi:hypothetical protein